MLKFKFIQINLIYFQFKELDKKQFFYSLNYSLRMMVTSNLIFCFYWVRIVI